MSPLDHNVTVLLISKSYFSISHSCRVTPIGSSVLPMSQSCNSVHKVLSKEFVVVSVRDPADCDSAAWALHPLLKTHLTCVFARCSVSFHSDQVIWLKEKTAPSWGRQVLTRDCGLDIPSLCSTRAPQAIVERDAALWCVLFSSETASHLPSFETLRQPLPLWQIPFAYNYLSICFSPHLHVGSSASLPQADKVTQSKMSRLQEMLDSSAYNRRVSLRIQPNPLNKYCICAKAISHFLVCRWFSISLFFCPLLSIKSEKVVGNVKIKRKIFAEMFFALAWNVCWSARVVGIFVLPNKPLC